MFLSISDEATSSQHTLNTDHLVKQLNYNVMAKKNKNVEILQLTAEVREYTYAHSAVKAEFGILFIVTFIAVFR